MLLELDPDGTQDDLITVVITAGGNTIQVMGTVSIREREVRLVGVHVHGAAPNALGAAALRSIVLAVLQEFDWDEIVIEGAVRTNGAGPGRKPKPVRFRRAARTALGE